MLPLVSGMLYINIITSAESIWFCQQVNTDTQVHTHTGLRLLKSNPNEAELTLVRIGLTMVVLL